MPKQFVSAFGRLRASIAGFSTAQRTVSLIGIAVLVLGIIALTSWISKPAYTPLFSGLAGADASAIVEQLRSENIPYELSNGGATVLVPEEYVYEQRLTAAAAGLPSSSTGGYSLLDSMGVTTSEFQQSVTFKRALEGELARTIGAMKGVRTASVQLAIPEETVFVADKAEPTASVFIETDNNVTLSSDQVSAIVHLTSASIEGMQATGVAVIDANGTVLSAVGSGLSGSADKQATDYEERVRTTVQNMLDRIVGPGNSTVAVAASVSSESAEVVTETFGATENVPALSESEDTEEFTGTGGGAAGVLGPDNIAVPDGEGGDGTYTSTSIVRDNAVNKVTESRTVPAGSIDRQTVSVAINREAAGDLNQPEIELLVTAAAGIEVDRGDSVAVQMVGFNSAAAEEAGDALAAAEAAAEADRIAELIRTGIIALAILIPVILALVLFLRRSRQKREPVEIEQELEIAELDPFATIPLPQVETAPSVASDMDVKRAEISRLAAQDPEKTADLLRGLMDERRPS